MWLLEEILCAIGQPTHVLHGQYVCVVYCKISGVCSVISTASGEWSSPAETLHYKSWVDHWPTKQYTILYCHSSSSLLLQESGQLQLWLGQSLVLSPCSPSPKLTAGGLWCMEERQVEDLLVMPMYLSWISGCVQYRIVEHVIMWQDVYD